MKPAKQIYSSKAIGRRLLHGGRLFSRGVAPYKVMIIAVIVASLGFLVGLKLDNFNFSFDEGFSANAGLPEDLDYKSVEEVYDLLKKDFDGELKFVELVDGLKKGLAEATGDNYTTYLNTEQAQEFSNDLNGTFEGIGMEVDKKGELIIVVAPLKGFPAEKAGLKKGDFVIKIDKTDIVGMSIEEAVRLIRGDRGTEVTLKVLRGNKQLDFTVTRERIVIPSVTYEMLNGGIGLISISRFAEDTEQLCLKAVADLDVDKLKGVILDLRGNSGGFITAARAVAGLWLKDKVVVEQRTNGGKKLVNSLKTDGTAPLAGIKTIVLIDEGSASASEIVAGALKDHGVAKLLGVKSYGKGSVQELDDLSGGGVLKVTVAKWYTPKGRNIDGQGIKPDITLKYKVGNIDNQLEAAKKLFK